MSFGTAIVVIVAILALTAMKIAKLRAYGDNHKQDRQGWREHRRGRGHALPSPREEELTREVEELRDRLAVLERIATDASSERRSKAISDEIEALRDR